MQYLVTKKAKKYLMSLPQVVGVGYGFKVTGGVVTDKPAVVTLVTKKLPPEELRKDDMIPPTLDGIITDVVEVGEIEAFKDNLPLKSADKVTLTNGHGTTYTGEERSSNEALRNEVEAPGSQQSFTDQWRPSPPGVSIGHYRITAGTFGAVVYQNKQPLILSK